MARRRVDPCPRGRAQADRMSYSIRAFAALAGVTVKTLRHYERHGLLAPPRSRAGYRRYTVRDLGQLEGILALKSLGLSLKQIAALAHDRASASRLALFREIDAALDRDPSGGEAGPLATRWDALLDAEACGDAATKAALQKAWANRRIWPDGVRRYVASLYDVEPDEWERVAAFLDVSLKADAAPAASTRIAVRSTDRPAPPSTPGRSTRRRR